MHTEPQPAPPDPASPHHRGPVGAALASAPLGVAVLGMTLAFAGALITGAGLYLLASGEDPRRYFWLFLIPAGLAGVHLGVKLVQRRPWARRAMLVLLGLLAASALLRAAFTPGLAYAVFVELIILVLLLRYLLRPRIVRAFTPST
jgi:hypothetical protein